ncbi:RNA polymerase sigma factor [Alicyclobacillus sp. ALC3]|uniref:RNA polymerase sigma factor n=1 Tax=Alicyclobacillus sp. ALC3 TaxID=2796143 RepID=UPI0023796E11|nr:RNA polymerase sigma factor [Alicyclobacillus sp. ALC3]
MSPATVARELFERYGDDVYRYLRFSLGSAHDADDLLQDVFVQVLQSWERFEHRSTERTWLFSIANHCVHDFLRKSNRRTPTVEITEDLADRTVIDWDIPIALEHSLRHLTLPQRQVFVMRVVQDVSTAETAAVLGWSEAKVKVTLHRAVKEIRKRFGEGASLDERAR